MAVLAAPGKSVVQSAFSLLVPTWSSADWHLADTRGQVSKSVLDASRS